MKNETVNAIDSQPGNKGIDPADQPDRIQTKAQNEPHTGSQESQNGPPTNLQTEPPASQVSVKGPDSWMQFDPPRSFTPLECLFAWLCLAAGYLICRIFPVGEHPLGGFLMILALFGVTAIVLKWRGCRLGKLSLLVAASAILISVALILSSNAFLLLFAYGYALVAYCYFLYKATGNTVKNGFSDLIVIDFIKALFVLPFYSFGQMFRAMFSGKANGSGKWIGKLIVGILIAVVPTVAVLVLLSYDSDFSALIQKIFYLDWRAIFSHLGSLVLGIPIGMYLFGLFVSSSDHKASQVLTAQSCKTAAQKMKIASSITVLAAVTPLLFVYVVFFISQWKYYISAFTGVLPQEFSYAQYARDGFFQLCAVSVINLVVIVAAVALMRRSTDRPPLLLKLLTVIYSVFTLVLISTAVAKMVMYINCYGLTPKRVYATWFMALLAVIFVLVVIRQFVQRLPAVAVSLSMCVVFFAALSLSNVDAQIARYNVNRYLDGSLETVDIVAMDELGDAAIPQLVHLAQVLQERNDAGTSTEEDDKLYWQLTIWLDREAEAWDAKEKAPFSFNLPSLKAEQALRQWEEVRADS